MKGLGAYIKKHGKHFTEELAYEVVGKRWSGRQIQKAAQHRVYYNVTGSTLGDMIYLTNSMGNKWDILKMPTCITFTLFIVGEFKYYGGVVFDTWLKDLEESKLAFDFTPYI